MISPQTRLYLSRLASISWMLWRWLTQTNLSQKKSEKIVFLVDFSMCASTCMGFWTPKHFRWHATILKSFVWRKSPFWGLVSKHFTIVLQIENELILYIYDCETSVNVVCKVNFVQYCLKKVLPLVQHYYVLPPRHKKYGLTLRTN